VATYHICTNLRHYHGPPRSLPQPQPGSETNVEFSSLGGHATAFLTELAKQAAASKGMHEGKLLACWRRKVSLTVHVAHADTVLRGFSAATYGMEAPPRGFFLGWVAFSCHGPLHPSHGPQAPPYFLEQRVRRRLSPPRVAFSAWPRSFLSFIC
jgi:hypothetical protein